MSRLPQKQGKHSRQLSTKLRTLFESTNDAIALIDPEGRIIDANPSFIKRYTKHHSECIETNIYAMMASDPLLRPLLAKRKKMGQKVIRTGKSVSFEDEQDGEVLQHNLYPVFSDTGEVAELFIISHDVTRQRQIETEFHDIKSKLDFILEKSHLGAWFLDLSTGVIMHTLEFDRMLGFDSRQPEWHYDAYRNLVIPEDRPKLDEVYRDMIEHLSSWSFQYRIRRVDGMIRWIEHFGGCERDRNGKATRLLGLTRDITDTKEVELQIRAQEVQWDFASRSCHLGLWKMDLETMSLTGNSEHMRILGVDSETAKRSGNMLMDFIVPEDRPAIRRLFRKALKEHQNTSFECRIRRPDGEVRWIHVMAAFQSGNNGKHDQLVGVVYDITERKTIEAEHQQLQEQLNQSQKLELLGQLAGGIAHDFNNVLAAILGNTELALRQIDGNQAIVDNLESIKISVKRSAEMVRQLLGFARRQYWQPQSIAIDRELEKLRLMLRQLIRENIGMQWDLHASGTCLSIDPSNLVQIITNLCINAVDAIVEEGTISIRTEAVDYSACKDLKKVAPDPGGEYVRISVTDTGTGIPPSSLPHIFEPFYTTKPIGKGTGLGLSMAYGLVRKNNGHITCCTGIDKGTTFNIYFPIEPAPGDTTPRESITRSFDIEFNDVTLLVEDEEGILSIIRKMLEQQGLAVLVAKNAETALDIFERQTEIISLVITDVLLPGMNGIQMSNVMKQKKATTRFIFMSGYSPDTIGHFGDFQKETNFISKPFTINDFLELVKAVIEQETL
ncbi:MAG: PAS domain S-box protein [Chlorobiaceae bacterium]|nr:PAS domain S-box protein [Chlorobiaceae bacterium]